MGGLNAFLAWTHMPHLFQAAAFQCPFFTKFNPFASARKRLHFAQTMHNVRAGSRPQRSAAIEENTKLLDMVIVGFKPHFSSFSDWMQHQPPFMMTRLKGQRLPPAYIVYSKRDQFGLNGAPEIGASGQSVVYEAIDGIHCERTATIGLARFLSDHPQMPHRGN